MKSICILHAHICQYIQQLKLRNGPFPGFIALHTHMDTHTRVCIHIHIYVCVCMYTHTHTHTHTMDFPSLMAHQVKNPPAMQETKEMWIWSLGWEDPLEEDNVNPLQYSCLEKSHGQRTHAGYSLKGHKELYMTEQVSTHTYIPYLFLLNITQIQKLKTIRIISIIVTVTPILNYHIIKACC